jgi:hypothetical protein
MLSACEGTGMILAAAAEYTPSPLRLMLGRPRVTRESGIGSPRRFPVFCPAGPGGGPGETGRESPFPDLAGKQGIPVSRFGRRPGGRESIGVPIRRAGDFKVPGLGPGRGVFLSWAPPGARLTECQVLRLPLPVAFGTNFGSPAAPGAGRPAL